MELVLLVFPLAAPFSDGTGYKFHVLCSELGEQSVDNLLTNTFCFSQSVCERRAPFVLRSSYGRNVYIDQQGNSPMMKRFNLGVIVYAVTCSNYIKLLL